MIFLDRFVWKGVTYGHLFSDTSLEELHTFAERIGLRREWFQSNKKAPHYDVIGTKTHSRALAAGAVSCMRKDVLMKQMHLCKYKG